MKALFPVSYYRTKEIENRKKGNFELALEYQDFANYMEEHDCDDEHVMECSFHRRGTTFKQVYGLC